VHTARRNERVGLVYVGFSPPPRQAAMARHLRWQGAVLADENRTLYALLGLSRAPLWRIYSPGTLLTYARGALRGHLPRPPAEDTRQLGADALVVDGTVVRLWRPRSPDDRPGAAEVVEAAEELLQA